MYEENEAVEVNEYNEDDITSSISNLLNDDLSINENIQEPEEETVVESVETVEETVPEDYKVTVKINGEDVEVPLSELKNGYQRQADYTKKTQELAGQRNELQQKEREYNEYLNSIPLLSQIATQNITEAQQKLYSPEFIQLAETDPAQYIGEKAKLERIINQNYQSQVDMQKQYQDHQSQWQKQREEEYNNQLIQAHEVLSKDIPGWGEGKVIDELRGYATSSMGFQPSELEGLIDPRQVKVLHKAMLYDQLMAQQNVTTKKVQSVPSKSLKPGSATTTEQQDEMKQKIKQVTRNGNDRDIASLISQMI